MVIAQWSRKDNCLGLQHMNIKSCFIVKSLTPNFFLETLINGFDLK